MFHTDLQLSNLTHDLFRFCVMNTDLTYASKEDFQTDAQIAAAKQNGEVAFKLIVHPGKKTLFESSFSLDLHPFSSQYCVLLWGCLIEHTLHTGSYEAA